MKLHLGAVPLLLAALLAAQATSEEAIAFFKRNCVSCHTIGGGRLTGPDLKGVLERRDRAWLTTFVTDPKAVLDSGDPYARTLLEEARGAVMPTLPGMTRDLAGKLLDLIQVESALPKSQFVGIQVSDRPLTAADVARGGRLFTGTDAFKNGGPACASCHTTRQLMGFGGGTLGPDLTSAFARLEGRKALGAWLSSPPSLTMQPVFQSHALEGDEILPLVAYLKSCAESGDAPVRAQPSLEFVLVAVAAAAGLLVLMDLLWRRRYRAVRRPLLARA